MVRQLCRRSRPFEWTGSRRRCSAHMVETRRWSCPGWRPSAGLCFRSWRAEPSPSRSCRRTRWRRLPRLFHHSYHNLLDEIVLSRREACGEKESYRRVTVRERVRGSSKEKGNWISEGCYESCESVFLSSFLGPKIDGKRHSSGLKSIASHPWSAPPAI